MQRPAHLTGENAARFGATSVADAYASRVPYTRAVLDILDSLAPDRPRALLDLGTGTGDLARPLAARFERVDAVDVSDAMIARGRALPSGAAPNLRWIHGRAEEASLSPPYALATAGESLHWMDWEKLMPRLTTVLAPSAFLAIVDRNELQVPWHHELMTLVKEISTMYNYQNYDLIELLQSRGLFELEGSRTAETENTLQSVDDYIRSFHSRASLTAEALGPDRARTFDERLRALVAPWADDGRVRLTWAPTVAWGRPLKPDD